MSSKTIAAVVVVVLMALSIWLGVVRYQECRARGFSRFFCASLK